MLTYLTRALHSLEGGARRQPVAEVSRGGYCLRLTTLALIATALMIINTQPSKADMNVKLYAYNKLTWQEFQCFNWLIYYESRWNHKARLGSHYGLGQMRSTWYRDLSARQQVDASIKYIRHRYGDSCKALAHFERWRWH